MKIKIQEYDELIILRIISDKAIGLKGLKDFLSLRLPDGDPRPIIIRTNAMDVSLRSKRRWILHGKDGKSFAYLSEDVIESIKMIGEIPKGSFIEYRYKE